MEPLSVKLNHIEYRLLFVDLQAKGHSQEAIANTAIALTAKLNKRIVPINRRDESILRQYPHHRLQNKPPEWEWVAFKQIIPQITPANMIALQNIMTQYSFKSKTDAFSYCIRTLAKYVEAKGHSIIDQYDKPDKEERRKLIKIPVKIKLTQIALAQIMVNADRQGIRVEDWIERLVYKTLE